MDDARVVAFGAPADPARRAILTRLREGDATVGELAAPFDASQPTISRHLKVLQNAAAGRLTPRRNLRRLRGSDAPSPRIIAWPFASRSPRVAAGRRGLPSAPGPRRLRHGTLGHGPRSHASRPRAGPVGARSPAAARGGSGPSPDPQMLHEAEVGQGVGQYLPRISLGALAAHDPYPA
nr:ArsR family transcriptional regulator [Protofrankia symbiont of Coriaria ruscifolia]